MPRRCRCELRKSQRPKSRGSASKPTALIRAGLVDELFASEPFRGTLSALQTEAVNLIDERLARLPEFTEPAARLSPTALATGAARLQQMIDRIDRALAFAEWREGAGEALKSFLEAVRRGDDGDLDAPRATAPVLFMRRSTINSWSSGGGHISTSLPAEPSSLTSKIIWVQHSRHAEVVFAMHSHHA